jgi:MFS family permease
MFLLLVTDEFWMFSIFAAILGLSGGGGTTLMSPLVAELFGIRSHGLILGVCAFSSTIGSATGPYAAGYIFDVAGSYQPAFIICAVLSVIGLALALVIRPPRRWQV